MKTLPPPNKEVDQTNHSLPFSISFFKFEVSACKGIFRRNEKSGLRNPPSTDTQGNSEAISTIRIKANIDLDKTPFET
jgi:hypothetical protein